MNHRAAASQYSILFLTKYILPGRHEDMIGCSLEVHAGVGPASNRVPAGPNGISERVSLLFADSYAIEGRNSDGVGSG